MSPVLTTGTTMFQENCPRVILIHRRAVPLPLSWGRLGERVAQLAIVPFLKAEFELSDELSDTVRGAGGFGSTGK